jgi:hypothetical protein
VNQSVKYRQTASECCEAARIRSDPREKAKMLAMAQSWILLADQAERKSHLKAATAGLTGHENRTRPYSIFLAKRLTGEIEDRGPTREEQGKDPAGCLARGSQRIP